MVYGRKYLECGGSCVMVFGGSCVMVCGGSCRICGRRLLVGGCRHRYMEVDLLPMERDISQGQITTWPSVVMSDLFWLYWYVLDGVCCDAYCLMCCYLHCMIYCVIYDVLCDV